MADRDLTGTTPENAPSCFIPGSSPCSRSPSQSQGSNSHDQHSQQTTLAVELTNGVFESETILDGLWPPREVELDAVMTCLRDVWEITPLPQSTNGGPAAERDYYRPLVKLLNRIFHACRIAGLKGFWSGMRFHIYDRTCADQVDGLPPLKPDCIGCLRDVQEGERVFRREIIIPIEVKNNWSKLVSQGAAYAQGVMSAVPGRQFVLVLCFNHDENVLRFAFYHPTGVNFSKPFPVFATDLDDLKGLVDAFVRLTSAVDPRMVGFDPSRSNNSFALPNSWGTYKVEEVLCERKCITGRMTVVYTLSASMPPTPKSQLQQTEPEEESRTDSELIGRLSLRCRYQIRPPEMDLLSLSLKCEAHNSRTATRSTGSSSEESEGRLVSRGGSSKPSAQHVPTLLNESTLPDRIVIKDAWSLQIRSQEGRMLRNTEGIILVTEGTNIVDSLGPAQLYTAVFHALLGHWNLFQGGLLHRNVSIGNVMIMPKEQSSTIMDFDETKPLTLCQGMFIDFDQTILWTCWKRKAALRRSGTLPFVSIRLLTQWVFKNHSTPLHNIHTAIDDLESFIWVLIWAVAECIKINKLEFSDDESRYIDDLCQEDVRSLVSRKKGIRYDYSTGPKRHPSKGFAPFGSLLHELLGAARSASEALDDLLIALSASSNSDSQQTVDTSEADQDYNPCVSPDGRCNHSLPQEFTALMEKTYQQFVATFAKNQEPLKHTKWE